MRLGGFYGITAANLIALQENHDVISFVRDLNSTLNGQILQDLSKEFYFLDRSLESLELQYDSTLKDDFYRNAPRCILQNERIVTPQDVPFDSFVESACHAAVISLGKAIQSGRPIDLSEFDGESTLDIYDSVIEIMQGFLLSYTQRFMAYKFADNLCRLFVKRFTGDTLNIANFDNLRKAFSVVEIIPDVIYQNNQRYDLSSNDKKVIQFYLCKRDTIHTFLKSINITTLADDQIFGIPFTSLISRNPYSLSYAVSNRFSYTIGANSMLPNVVSEVRSEIKRFKELKDEKVKLIDSGSNEVEVSSDDFDKFVSNFTTDKQNFFISVVNEGYLCLEDVSWKDLKSLADLYDLATMIDIKWYNNLFGTDYQVATFYDEIQTLNKLGIAGLNLSTFDLFNASMQSVVLSMNNVYEKSEEYFITLNGILADIDALLDTIIPIGTALG